MPIRTLLFLAASIMCTPALAKDYEDIVQKATARYDDSFVDRWSFTETRTVNEEIRVANYDPARPSGHGWKLLSINNEPPDEDAVAEFLNEKADREAERDENAEEDDLYEMITPGSLDLIEETPTSWRFSFQPQDDEDEVFMEHVAGELTVVKGGYYLETMILRSRGPFKPQAGVKINDFVMQMKFGPAGNAGPIVPVAVRSRVSGKAFLVAKIDEDVVVEFSDYKQVVQ